MPFALPGTRSKENDGRVTKSTRKWRIFWSYLPDWIITILLWGLFYLLDKIDGYRRLFDVTDTSLAHPYSDPERIKVWHLAIYAGIIPALFIALTGSFVRKSVWDVHAGLLGFILNLGLCISFTNIIKVTAGRPRPDLFDRCQLPPDLTSNPVHGLTSWTVCTRTDMLQEGFRSFPSGHSSFAWAGFWYLVLYGAAKMGVSNQLGHTWKSWILLAPISAAALVSISRLMDYRHHPTDVIAGALIGMFTAWYAYRQFYPALSHPQAYKPYSPRIPKDDAIPLHHTHEASRHSTEGLITSAQHGRLASHRPSDSTHNYPPTGYGTSYAAGLTNPQTLGAGSAANGIKPKPSYETGATSTSENSEFADATLQAPVQEDIGGRRDVGERAETVRRQ